MHRYTDILLFNIYIDMPGYIQVMPDFPPGIILLRFLSSLFYRNTF